MTHYGYKHWTLEETPRCFNVGKGRKGRSRNYKNRNHKWHAIVKRFGLRVEVCVGPLTNEEACAWEIEWIAKEKTYTTNHSHDDPNDIGCNFTRGGEGVTGWRHKPETRLLFSQTRKGVPHGPMSESHKRNLSAARSGWKDSETTRRAKSLAQQRPETRAKRSEAKSRPVAQCDLKGQIIQVYPSVNAAAHATGGDKGCIAICARGKRNNPVHKGFLWVYLDRMQSGTS